MIILDLFFLFIVVYYPLKLMVEVFEWIFQKVGLVKSPIEFKSYSLENVVLKPLGYTPSYYKLENDIFCILKVQKELVKLRKDSNLYSDSWAYIYEDLKSNMQLEESYIKNLNK